MKNKDKRFIHIDFLNDEEYDIETNCTNAERVCTILELADQLAQSAKKDMGQVPEQVAIIGMACLEMIEASKQDTKEARA